MNKKSLVYVLTEEHNEYDQYGEYFRAVFSERPSVEVLAEYCAKNDIWVGNNVSEGLAFLLHLQKGGGRRGTEQVWYHLKEAEVLESK